MSPFGAPLFRTLNQEADPADSGIPGSTFAQAATDGLTVADVLPQLPPELARASSVPQGQAVNIAPAVLKQALSSGRLAVPLFEIYRVCPGIFLGPVAPDDQRMINLPPAKLPSLISAASAASESPAAAVFQPVTAPASPFLSAAPASSPLFPAAASAPASPFASLFTEASQEPPVPTKPVSLPPRRDPAQTPASSLPPSPFLDEGSPFAASAPASPFVESTPLQPPGADTLPVSLFPSAPPAVAPQGPMAARFSLFPVSESEPTVPPPVFPAQPAPAPFAPAPEDKATPSTAAPKISGAATASLAALLEGQKAEELGFDPAMVPTWITTQFHGGLVAELQDMPVPAMDLGTIVDGITDVGFRNVLGSARRAHTVQIPLEVLTPLETVAAGPAASTPAITLQPAPSLANPFMTSAVPAAAPNPFKIEPGNPFAAVPDAPAADSTPEEPAPQPPPAPPFEVVAKPPGANLIQPKTDIEGMLTVAAPQSNTTLPAPKSQPRIIDPFAPSEKSGAPSGLSSFDLFGGNPDAPPPLPEAPAPFPPAAEPAAAPPAPEPAPVAEAPVFAMPEPVSPEASEKPAFSFPPSVDLDEEKPAAKTDAPMPASFAPSPPAPVIAPASKAASAAPSSLGLSAAPTLGEEQLLLRALLDSDEILGIQRVLELTCALPGIAACALIRQDTLVAAHANASSEIDAPAFRSQAAGVARNLRALAPLIGIADAETFTLNSGTRLITLCCPGEVTLAVLHEREPSPAQRDKLTLVARQLARLVDAV